MIERQFISEKMKEYLIAEYIAETLKNVGLSHTKLVKTPSGVKIIIYAAKPGLIVGKRGANIRELTQTMKTKFKLDNPQIEIAEVDNLNLDANIVAEKIASALERFGTQRFKGVGHKILSDVMAAGARGIEVTISGKIPSARAKTWRFYAGYLKKCGDIAVNYVKKAVAAANLKSGTVGIQVKIMPPDIQLPDDINVYDEMKVEEIAVQEKKDAEEKELKKAAKKGARKPREHKEKKEAKQSKPKTEKHVEKTPEYKPEQVQKQPHAEKKQEIKQTKPETAPEVKQ